MQEFLSKVPLFRTLDKADIAEIANGMGRKSFEKGSTIFEQGDTGDAFYIVAVGVASVLLRQQSPMKVGDFVELQADLTFAGKIIPKGSTAKVDKFDGSRDYPYTIKVQDTKFAGQRGHVLAEEIDLKEGRPEPKEVARLKPGDYFGEQSLLRGKPRNATIKAAENMECGVIDGNLFKKLGLGEKLSFAKRKAVQTFESREKKAGGDTTKNDAEKKLIADSVMSNKKLNEIIKLEATQLTSLVESAWKRPCNPGDKIIEQGDLQADEFYVVKDGEYDISIADSTDANAKIGASQVVGTVKSGASFGELALLYQAPRAATITCRVAGTLFVIDRSNFKGALREANEAKTNGFLKTINATCLADYLFDDEKQKLANALFEKQFSEGDCIKTEDDSTGAFYILVEGKISFTKKGEDGQNNFVSQMDVDNKKNGCFFGQGCFVKKEHCQTAVRVTSKRAAVLVLSKDRFNDILGSLAEISEVEEPNTLSVTKFGTLKNGEFEPKTKGNNGREIKLQTEEDVKRVKPPTRGKSESARANHKSKNWSRVEKFILK